MTSTLSVPYRVTTDRPRLRVALVTHNVCRGDGQGRVNYEIVRHLSARGVQFLLVADRVAPELLGTTVQWMPLHPILGRPNLIKCWDLARLADRAADDIRRRVHLTVANGFVTRRPHEINISHMVHSAWFRSPVHISRTMGGPRRWYQWAYTRANITWERQAYLAARAVVAVSEKVRRDLLEIGVATERIRVIHNGVDLDEFRPGHQSRSELGLPRGVPLALFVGNIKTRGKNLDSVLRALKESPGLHLAVVGRLAGSPFPAMARELGVSARTHFLGFRSDIADIMRACDFYVFPSRYEACNLSVLEALASGLPVITAATVGNSDLVTPECGHVLRDSEDRATLGSWMRRFAQDVTLRRQCANAARLAAEAHGWSRMAQGYFNLFETVATRQAPTAR